MLNQFITIVFMNLRNLRHRLASSQMIVLGVGGVVTVMVALLTLSTGLETTLSGSAKEDRIVIVRAGATSEINGAISPNQAQIVRYLPGIKRQGDEPIAAAESYASINLESVVGHYRSTPLRGTSADSFTVRSEIELIEGRMPDAGRAEILVGRALAAEHPILAPGYTFRIKNLPFTVVGTFTSNGSLFESELWTNVEVVNDLFRRNGQFSSITLQMSSAEALAELQSLIDEDPRLTLSLHTESDFYGAQAEITRQLISSMAWLLGIIMSVGAIFSVVNTMYTATATRTQEIATLRALGFGRWTVISSVLIESLVLAVIGALLAIAILYLMMDGMVISTMGSTTLLAIELQLDTDAVLLGTSLAVGLGLMGAILPAIKSTTAPIASGLRKV